MTCRKLEKLLEECQSGLERCNSLQYREQILANENLELKNRLKDVRGENAEKTALITQMEGADCVQNIVFLHTFRDQTYVHVRSLIPRP